MSSHGYILRKVPAAQWKQWDQFVNEHPRGHFLQSWGWGELKANGGWYPLRLALMDEQQQQIVAAAQVLCRTPAHLPLWAGNRLVAAPVMPGFLHATQRIPAPTRGTCSTYGAKSRGEGT